MKAKPTILALAFLLAAPGAWAKGKEINIGVKGMVCGFCAQGIEKKFHANAAIDQVKVSLGQKQVKLTTKDGQDISDEVIRQLLAESGYNVEKIERNQP